MAVQDRNVHRDAQFGRDQVAVPLVSSPTAANKDEVSFLFRPRYNFRLTDLQGSAAAVATAAIAARAAIAKELSAIGAPQFGAAAATTFTIEALQQIDAGVLVDVAATAAQAFSGAFTVLDGFWGVVTVQIDGAQAITTKVASGTMAFETEEDAIKNAPAPDAGNGLVGVLTIEASGANFVGGTDNTNTANSFNTIDRGGHAVSLPVSTVPQVVRATQANRLYVGKVGNLVGQAGDYLAVTIRSANALAALTNGVALVELRKFGQQGDAGPDVATGLTSPAVP